MPDGLRLINAMLPERAPLTDEDPWTRALMEQIVQEIRKSMESTLRWADRLTIKV